MKHGSASRLIAALPFAFALWATPTLASTLDESLQLNTSITVTGGDVTLGDVFTGYLSRPEKVVAKAPRPGQRMVLTSDWLSKLANTYGLNWAPANAYDRAVVFQPGQAIAPQEIIAAVKAELLAKGMPANFSLAPATNVPTITVSVGADTTIGVREAYFDAAAKTFAAVVEVPQGQPDAQFISLRGKSFPVVTVPTLKDGAAKNTLITEDMLTTLDVAEDQMRPDTITDARALIGKAPKMFLRAGLPVREADVERMNLVEIPVLSADVARGSAIAKNLVTFVSFNTADLPADVITDASLLQGRTSRRMLVAGAPVRRGDVELVRQVQVPVAARDLDRGETLGDEDISWVSMSQGDVASNAISEEDALVGLQAKHNIRAGQTLRKFDVKRPIAVPRGKLVTILWSARAMNLTVQGQALEAGGVGEIIKVANTKSKTTVMAEVIDAATVRIAAQ